jgi:Na+-translocating ferredoxin:NAD+ oxidoreductase RNF subunit RnfB
LSSIRYFRDEWDAHVKEGKCAALVCKPLLTYEILPEKCKGCDSCAKACPVKAITGERAKVHVINQEACIKCGTCLAKCPDRFNAIVKSSGGKTAKSKEPVLTGKQ